MRGHILDSPEDAAARSAGAAMLHACDGAPQHNSTSSHAGQGTVLPSIAISERASVPFVTAYASVDVTATSSQTEMLQEGCAASELDACPHHGDMAYPWEEDEASVTGAQSLDAYTGKHLVGLLPFPLNMCRSFAHQVLMRRPL